MQIGHLWSGTCQKVWKTNNPQLPRFAFVKRSYGCFTNTDVKRKKEREERRERMIHGKLATTNNIILFQGWKTRALK